MTRKMQPGYPQPELQETEAAAAAARNIANTTSQILAAVFQGTRSCSIHELCDASCSNNAADVVCTPILTPPYYLVNVGLQSSPSRDRTEPLEFPTTSATFSYSPLDASKREFRLIRVKKGVFRADFVDCDLLTFTLDDSTPPYTALSYCWGTDPPDRRILCNGAIFPARPSLEGALKRFRAADHEGDSNEDEGSDRAQELPLIWVDAICIDQANISEKNTQLLMMQDIYRRSRTVYVDLGDVTPLWYPGYDLLNRAFALASTPALAAEAALPPLNHRSNCWAAYWSILETP